MTSRTIPVSFFIVFHANPTSATYLYGPHRAVTYVPDAMVLLLGVLVLAVCVGLLAACIEDISSPSRIVSEASRG